MLEFFTGTKEEKAAQRTLKSLKQKERLSRRQESQLLHAEKLSTRLLRKRLGGTLALVGICVAGTFGIARIYEDQTALNKLPDWLKVEDVDKIGKNRAIEAVSAAIEWDNRFNCGRSVVIRRLQDPFSKELPGGFVVQQEELSYPGIIHIADKVSPRNNVLHGMTHACTPDVSTKIDPPLLFEDGFITGYAGLILEVTVHSGQKVKFNKFEEGMAERNASAFKGYTISNPAYANVGSLTIRAFPITTDSIVHEWAKNNYVPSFIRAKLKLPEGSPVTGTHLETVMSEYEQAWNRGMSQLSPP